MLPWCCQWWRRFPIQLYRRTPFGAPAQHSKSPVQAGVRELETRNAADWKSAPRALSPPGPFGGWQAAAPADRRTRNK